jgi:diguanylate cyclase (GGDEF)-like protein/PAS domain S-box-containing protein
LRLHRHRITTATSLLVIGILYAAHLLGALPRSAFFTCTCAILLSVLVFYVVFRSGLNRRFRDPSLTLAQMSVATTVILFAMYAAGSGGAVFLLLLLMVFLFGVLRFGTRILLAYAVFILFAHGGTILLLWLNKRESIDFRVEALQWLTLALTLPWFVWMGGYIKGLRTQLRKRNAELEQALRTATLSESNLAEAQRIAKVGMWTVDPVSKAITWSAQTFRLFGLDQEKGVPVGRDFTRLIHPDDRQGYRNQIRPAMLEGRDFDGNFRIVLPAGEVRWLHALGRPVMDLDGKTSLVRGTLRDITEQHEADEHIRRLAHFDSLTGLPNRSLFNHLLARALARSARRSAPLAVFFIDLDGFKKINDELGHAAGDALLAAFASRLTSVLRTSDAAGRVEPLESAARLGGDEFVVLIEDFSDGTQVDLVAEKILAAMKAPFSVGIETCFIGVSIGIALSPRDGDSLDRLMHSADSAMYAAKQAGKNTYRYFSAPAVVGY